ncbi:MAG: tRNA-queuosine alpha-mannosyltransferase domain-containing protein [Spirochaetia bacterium]
MRLLYLEPYYGGSHRAIADAFIDHTGFEVDRLTMPARHWKWRLRGAAYHFVPKIEKLERAGNGGWDVVVCSSLLDVSLLRGMWASAPGTPIVQYVHEHQFSYPGRSGLAPDANYPLTDLSSALASDAVFFNSEYCRSSFLEGAATLLSRMPDYRCSHMVQRVADKSAVLYPGAAHDTPHMEHGTLPRSSRPCILWNHRWEHDKNPESFFEALKILDLDGLDFSLVVTGGRYRGSPEQLFEDARMRFADRIVHWGFVREREEYSRIVSACDIVVSTARQENFGLSVLEAVRCGLLPVLPGRLSYPELYGQGDAVLFDPGDNEPVSLAESLRRVLADGPALSQERRSRRMQWAERFDWSRRIADWDTALQYWCG